MCSKQEPAMQELQTMTRLLAPINRRTLLQWTQEDTLFAFDFDGTLAPITDDPDQAFMSHPTWRALAALSALARVAVISGRSRADLLRRLPVEVAYVVGNHGNEGLPADNGAHRVEQARCCNDWLAQLSALKACSPQWACLLGSLIEDKGLSLSLHYRRCDDRVRAHDILSAFIEKLVPPAQVLEGAQVINLLPPNAQSKVDALTMLMAHSGCARALYVGDDSTDESVFAAAPDHWLTARVGYAGRSCARYRLANVREVRTLIELAVRQRQMVASKALGLSCS